MYKKPRIILQLLFIFLLVFSVSSASAETSGKKISVLILRHQDTKSDPNGPPLHSDNAIMLANLIGHFKAETVRMPIESYYSGLLKNYDFVFYIGDQLKAAVPAVFLDDVIKNPKTKVIWIRWNIDQLLARAGDYYGFKILPLIGGFEWVSYQNVEHLRELNADLVRPDTEEIDVVQIMDWKTVQTFGVLRSDAGFAPFSVQAKNLWFFPDSIFFGISNLIFADLLHEVFGIPHESNQQFYVRLEDIHPLRDPGRLRENCKTLFKEKVPFMMGVISQYRKPGQDKPIYLKDKPHLVRALLDCASMGGSFLMHGYTHQHGNETGEGHEFWDVAQDRAIPEYNDDVIREKIEKGLDELVAIGIYPIAWETPHYSASSEVYKIIAQYFTTAVEERQVSDRTYRLTQAMPYIAEDIYGQTIVPENLGYINLDEGETMDKKIANLMPYKIVRDAVVGVFFHPYYEPKYLNDLVRKLKKTGFSPMDLRNFPNTVFGQRQLIFSGLAGTPVVRPSDRVVPFEDSNRIFRVKLRDEWIKTFLVNYDYQILDERWFYTDEAGEALIELPARLQSLFVVEMGIPKPTNYEIVKSAIFNFILGKTRNPVETFERWMVWFFCLMTFALLLVALRILIIRTAYHPSHFRREAGLDPDEDKDRD